jgi:hypothetical protein
MTTPISVPGPRDGLDEGSLDELVQDGRETVVADVGRLRPWVTSTEGPIDVPDNASTLIEGLTAYGA